jgi:hypothetical protein
VARSRLLFILVEGDNDERFVRAAVCGDIRRSYDSITVWKWAEEKDSIVNQFVGVITGMGAEYIFLADQNAHPCVTAAKSSVTGKYPNVSADRVVIANSEVEAWYLGGLTATGATACGLDTSHGASRTDGVTKEQFCALQPSRYVSETAFRVDVLKQFDRRTAIRRNASFAYLARKYLRR